MRNEEKIPNLSHQLSENEDVICVTKNGVKVYVVVESKTKRKAAKKVSKVDGFHLLGLMDYIYKNKSSILDPVNGLSVHDCITCGYKQHLNSLNGNKMEANFRSVLEDEGIIFLDEPYELSRVKKFDHFIEFNGEYYCIEQKQKDNHDHRKDIGEITAIKNFPDEYQGKKINKYIWFVSNDKGKTSNSASVNVLRGDEVLGLFFNDKAECERLYRKLLNKNKKKDVEAVFDLDSNYENKIEFLFKHCGKKPKEYKKFITNDDWMTCMKSLSKKNKFAEKFVETYNKLAEQ